MSVLLVAGAGPGVGAALERRFSSEGYTVALAARSVQPGATTFPTDLSREEDVVRLFDAVESGLGAIDVVAFVAATRREAPLLEVTADDFERHWRQNTFAGFLVGREAARRMLPRRRGTILYTGASTSFRGRARFAAFSAAKGGLRFLVQSMARELGPQGLHVATVLIEGAIDNPHMWTHERARMEKAGPDGAVLPDAIADAYWQLHNQPRNAWTQELDLRPWSQSF
jgi:NAD(P)-dependent dehydrogenase (short-subunit alcohol dehydrogenase family)